jgi:hypothetical protein
MASGTRSTSEATVLVIAIARHNANNPELACCGVAPTAARPASTMTKEVAKPLIAAIRPARMG